MDGSSEHVGWQNEPLGEDFAAPPYKEEAREWARIAREGNQDNLRHFVEVLAWETFDHPGLRRYLVPIFWLIEDIDPRWIAEAFFMSVHDVCATVEGNQIVSFNCLDCGTELPAHDRDQLFRMNESLRAGLDQKDRGGEDAFDNLRCPSCLDQRARQEEEQRQLDDLRLQALLAEYRRRPYAERRSTREWAVLRMRVFRRDGYRCKLCGRNDLALHLHHSVYTNYAREKLEDVITLCEVCHERHHRLEDAS